MESNPPPDPGRFIATNPETGQQETKTVTHTHVHNDTVTDLVIDGETITTTEDHPFWSVTDHQYEPANQLAPGEQVLNANGHTMTVTGLQPTTSRQAPAYNLTVQGIPSYHIGHTQTLVHNCGPGSVPDPSPVTKPNGAPDRSSPWYVSFSDTDGKLQTVGNLDGVHAEARIQEMQPGTPMSRPFGWRTLESANGPEWVEGTVCQQCQVYQRSLFPPGTRGASGGPWGD